MRAVSCQTGRVGRLILHMSPMGARGDRGRLGLRPDRQPIPGRRCPGLACSRQAGSRTRPGCCQLSASPASRFENSPVRRHNFLGSESTPIIGKHTAAALRLRTFRKIRLPVEGAPDKLRTYFSVDTKRQQLSSRCALRSAGCACGPFGDVTPKSDGQNLRL